MARASEVAPVEIRLRRHGIAGSALGLRERQEEVAAGGLVVGAVPLRDLEAAREVRHRLLEGQQPQRPLSGGRQYRTALSPSPTAAPREK